jgi:CRP-like cAMP-binding protein
MSPVRAVYSSRRLEFKDALCGDAHRVHLYSLTERGKTMNHGDLNSHSRLEDRGAKTNDCVVTTNREPGDVDDPAPLDSLRRHVPGVVRRIAAGQHIAIEGEASGQVIGVIAGVVRCFRLTADGRRHISRFAGHGALIGLGLLGVQRYSAETINDVQVVYLRAETIEVESQANATVRKAVMRALTDELNEGARSQTRLGCLNAEQRLADFLLGLIVDDAQSTPIEMSRADIADHLGLTIETVSRAFSKFAKLGLIDLINPHRFRAPNPARLRRLVEGRIAASEPVLDADAMTRATIAF